MENHANERLTEVQKPAIDAVERAIPDALTLASNAANLLVDVGVKVLGAYANGRRPVLLIESPPRFVHGVIKHRCRPHDGSQSLTLAAGFQGCQLEWSINIPVMQEVRNG